MPVTIMDPAGVRLDNDGYNSDRGYFHAGNCVSNSLVVGFLNTDANWLMYSSNIGEIVFLNPETGSYVWLHDHYLNSVGNCVYPGFSSTGYLPEYGAPPTTVINCYGSGSSIAGYQWEINKNGGSANIRVVRYYYTPGGGGGGGGPCFTEDTLVELVDGSIKPISEIKLGDKVWNKDKSSANEVKFIEQGTDTTMEYLYSPDKNLKPFATINHPIYVNDKLYSADPDTVYSVHPWLGKTEKIDNAQIIPALGQKVYNLWVDGDYTYRVNGYGTHSIMGHGDALARVANKNYLTSAEVSNLIGEWYKDSRFTLYGGYLVNKFIGFINVDLLDKFMSNGLKKKNWIYSATKVFSKIVGYIAHPDKKIKINILKPSVN